MKISTILDQIDLGSIALPEFQRSYVWNRDQVRRLTASLYRRHPVGSLLVWLTKTENADARGEGKVAPGTVELLLDGQQRITTLYGIIRGRPPQFFDGDPQTFFNIYFNIQDEIFEFYAPLRMKDNPLWISVTDLMQKGVGAYLTRLMKNQDLLADIQTYINRLNALEGIKEIDLHIDQITGDEKSIDVVVEIFNNVNSGGTKLSKGDLALAKICASWPQARSEMKTRLAKWRNARFEFRMEWLLRDINAIITGDAYFSALKDVQTSQFRDGLLQTEKAVDYLLNLISSRLGLDHDQVLGSRYSFPVMARYILACGGLITDHRDRDRLLYWYVNTFLWGRYAGSTETVLSQDLKAIEDHQHGLGNLIDLLRQSRGALQVRPDDFLGSSRGARFYPLLYMLTRVRHSLDFDSGVELTSHLLGKQSALQIHHLFPKARLYKHGYSKGEVNAIANFTFLTQETNLRISDRLPEEYLPEIAKLHPGALESHWIPMNPALWKMDRYLDFLTARRELLSTAANEFLSSLLHGPSAEEPIAPAVLEHPIGPSVESEEDHQIGACNEWIMSHGLPAGEGQYELLDRDTDRLIAILDLAWPDGLQKGYSQPVSLLIDAEDDILKNINQAGFRYFTTVEDLRAYVEHEVLAMALENAK